MAASMVSATSKNVVVNADKEENKLDWRISIRIHFFQDDQGSSLHWIVWPKSFPESSDFDLESAKFVLKALQPASLPSQNWKNEIYFARKCSVATRILLQQDHCINFSKACFVFAVGNVSRHIDTTHVENFENARYKLQGENACSYGSFSGTRVYQS